MATISEKIKQALASIEQVRKDLNSLDEAHAEAEALRRVLDGRRGELGEVEQRLARITEEHARADAAHAEWSQATAKQRVEGNAKIDRLQAQLQILESSVKERQAEHDNILEGMAALGRRLRATG